MTAAGAIVPLLTGFCAPQSVLDVGCGAGAMLATFAAAGLVDLVGLDDDAVDAGVFCCDPTFITRVDLAQPFDLGRRFDLVVSLEVAEHLSKDHARAFVASLVRHGDVILFSAAIPGQGGVNHVNEQWQSWWAEIFGSMGFRCLDVIRPVIWNEAAMPIWYKQNAFLYVKEGVATPVVPAEPWPLDLAYPLIVDRPLRLRVGEASVELVRSARRSLTYWSGRARQRQRR